MINAGMLFRARSEQQERAERWPARSAISRHIPCRRSLPMGTCRSAA